MAVIGIDLGGTKIAGGIVKSHGKITRQETVSIKGKEGNQVGESILELIGELLEDKKAATEKIDAIGISVPGIYYSDSGKVWAPNISGWEEYPLLEQISSEIGDIRVRIDSDRACYILGETWQGAARGCRDAIFIAVGTGIGAGIMVNGSILRGHRDIAGATGWMALNKSYREGYKKYGCFEYHASGDGLARSALDIMAEKIDYSGKFRNIDAKKISSYDIFREYENDDEIAVKVIEQAIAYWGMAAANFISLFNPEKIIFGGGVFGPAAKFLNDIQGEAGKWSQPIAFRQVEFETTKLGKNAGLIGAGKLGYNSLKSVN
mgnify:CR=1 FL=1